MIISWPPELVSDIARRRCVIFLGSGISKHARNKAGEAPKTWREFLQAGALRIPGPPILLSQISNLISKNDFLTACQLIKDAMGGPQFHDFVKQEYLTPDFKAAGIHKTIKDLDSRLVATPNFDKIYENQTAAIAVKNYYDSDVAQCLRGTARVVIKVHGTIDTPPKMIFTREEYALARNEYRYFYGILEALAITHTFLFLGCGLEDPDIRLLLEDYAFRHHFCRPHYIVLPKGLVHRCTQSAVEKSLNLKLLIYDKRSHHHLLKPALDELLIAVNLQRSDLLKTGDW